MVDKSKMSVADMLAAARKADSQGGAPAEKLRPLRCAEEARLKLPRQSRCARCEEAGRRWRKPSVAEMLAMARAEKAGDARRQLRLKSRREAGCKTGGCQSSAARKKSLRSQAGAR